MRKINEDGDVTVKCPGKFDFCLGMACAVWQRQYDYKLNAVQLHVYCIQIIQRLKLIMEFVD